MQQPLDPPTQQKLPTGGMTQVQMGTTTPHLRQTVIIGQQHMASQP